MVKIYDISNDHSLSVVKNWLQLLPLMWSAGNYSILLIGCTKKYIHNDIIHRLWGIVRWGCVIRQYMAKMVEKYGFLHCWPYVGLPMQEYLLAGGTASSWREEFFSSSTCLGYFLFHNYFLPFPCFLYCHKAPLYFMLVLFYYYYHLGLWCRVASLPGKGDGIYILYYHSLHIHTKMVTKELDALWRFSKLLCPTQLLSFYKGLIHSCI